MSKEGLEAYTEKLLRVTRHVQGKLQTKKADNKDVKKITGTDFETIVYDSLIEAGFKEENILHSAQKFPDFIIQTDGGGNKIGIEVKKTDGSKWEVIGGSIYESLKNDIEDTYVLMAKMGGEKPEVRLQKYDKCIEDLKVTHSPRFYLNLDLKDGEDYLTQNNARDLLDLSGNELNKKIRQLLRTQKSTWWSEGSTVSFSELTREEKGIYLNEGIALFPEVFKGDYQKFTPWLIYSCFVWCENVRDIFSAGGNIFVNEINIYVSAIMYRALENVDAIKCRIYEMTEEEQIKFWGRGVGDKERRIDIWLKFVEENLVFSSKLLENNNKLPVFENCDKEQVSLSIRKKFTSELSRRLKSN